MKLYPGSPIYEIGATHLSEKAGPCRGKCLSSESVYAQPKLKILLMLSLLAVAVLGGAFLFLWSLRGVRVQKSKTGGALPRRECPGVVFHHGAGVESWIATWTKGKRGRKYF